MSEEDNAPEEARVGLIDEEVLALKLDILGGGVNELILYYALLQMILVVPADAVGLSSAAW